MRPINCKNQVAQGDILITRIGVLPANAVPVMPENGKHIVAHSETGHHHTVDAHGVQVFEAANDPFVLYLVVDNKHADIIHNRAFDTHNPVRLPRGVYRINRQREYTPEGWRRVAD